VHECKEEDESAHQKYEKYFGGMSLVLANSLGRFEVREKEVERRTRRGGKINSRYVQNELINLHAGRDLEQRIYDRRRNKHQEEMRANMDIGLLLDQSGSTRFDVDDAYTRIDLIKYSGITIGRSLRGLDDSFFIYAFHTHRSADPTIMEELKRPDEQWNSHVERRIVALRETSTTEYFNNKDGAAIRFSNESLLAMPHQKKYLFLVTDGNPNCDYCYYQDELAFEDTKKAMEEGRRKGIRYIYLTINPEASADKFMGRIHDVTSFSKRYTRMRDVVEGLTVAYEAIKARRY
jgi:nitric oxide reductase activation protein